MSLSGNAAATRARSAKLLVWIFNIEGSLDLVVAIALATVHDAPPFMGPALDSGVLGSGTVGDPISHVPCSSSEPPADASVDGLELGLRERSVINPKLKKLSRCPDAQWDQEGKHEIANEKTKPTVCALLRTIPCGDLYDLFDPIAAQPFITAECGVMVLFRLKACGENEAIFDGHGSSLPSMGPDRVGRGCPAGFT